MDGLALRPSPQLDRLLHNVLGLRRSEIAHYRCGGKLQYQHAGISLGYLAGGVGWWNSTGSGEAEVDKLLRDADVSI